MESNAKFVTFDGLNFINLNLVKRISIEEHFECRNKSEYRSFKVLVDKEVFYESPDYKCYSHKTANIEKEKQYDDHLESALNVIENNESSFQISKG